MATHKMYSVSPMVNIPDVLETSRAMYKMSKVYNLPQNLKKTYYEGQMPVFKSNSLTDSFPKKNNMVRDSARKTTMEELKHRQENILEKLKHIKETLHNFRGAPFASSSAEFESLKRGVIHDIVVSANPANPPYFLLPIKKLLQQSELRVLSTCSVHSSIDHVDPNVSKLFKDDMTKERGSHDVSLTVLWKNQSTKSLMVNPLKQCLVVGEANILRYISRLFPAISPLNYESQGSFTSVSETDYWLDTIENKFLQGGSKERQSFLKQMNSKLGIAMWMDGNRFGLCDVFCWSVILQLRLTAGLPSNVSSWFKRLTEALRLEELGLSSQSQELASGDGSCKSHVDRKGLEDFLKNNGIQYQSRNHEEVFTVEALVNCVKDMPGIHMKNLFLKDKKKDLYLLAARHDVQVKLNDVGNQVGARDLRFGNQEILFETLGVKQGCVTLYALLNDPSHQVTLLLDAEVAKTDRSYVNFHPMTNDATLGISPGDLQKFLKLTGHKVHLVNL